MLINLLIKEPWKPFCQLIGCSPARLYFACNVAIFLSIKRKNYFSFFYEDLYFWRDIIYLLANRDENMKQFSKKKAFNENENKGIAFVYSKKTTKNFEIIT